MSEIPKYRCCIQSEYHVADANDQLVPAKDLIAEFNRLQSQLSGAQTEIIRWKSKYERADEQVDNCLCDAKLQAEIRDKLEAEIERLESQLKTAQLAQLKLAKRLRESDAELVGVQAENEQLKKNVVDGVVIAKVVRDECGTIKELEIEGGNMDRAVFRPYSVTMI